MYMDEEPNYSLESPNKPLNYNFIIIIITISIIITIIIIIIVIIIIMYINVIDCYKCHPALMVINGNNCYRWYVLDYYKWHTLLFEMTIIDIDYYE